MTEKNEPQLPVVRTLQGLPMRELIAAPLIASSEAQILLAQAAYRYMSSTGFQPVDPSDLSKGADFTKPNILKFDMERPVESTDGITASKITVQAPFLGLVPIPSLLIDGVEIGFQMEITDTAWSKSEQKSDVNGKAEADLHFGVFGSGHVEIGGKVTSSRENTRKTNQTAKYHVKVTAKQQPQTEGLSKLVDMLASCTAVLEVRPEKR